MTSGLSRSVEADVRAAASRAQRLRHAYGFDDVALVPGTETIDPDDVDIAWQLGEHSLPLPFLASAMDGVVSPSFAAALGTLGGVAVLNLEGLQTRYADAEGILAEIAETPKDDVTALLQRLYTAPIQDELVGRRIAEVRAAGVLAVGSVTPARAEHLSHIAVEAGAGAVVVQSTVTTNRFRSTKSSYLNFEAFCRALPVPVIVGNTVTFAATLELMQAGASAVLVGVGPGAACTSREVLGIGVPQVTATMDCAAARDEYYTRSGRYVPIITDGGMRTGGDVCKAFASGADAVMIGSPFAQTVEAPGQGNHWGMATPHGALPRGTRIKVGVNTTLERLLFGPTSRTDGTENLVGALRQCMGVCGAGSIAEMHDTEIVLAPAIKTEGKRWQLSGAL
jgi:IMP dehydrogenase